MAQSQKRSAVYDIVTNPTNVTVNVVGRPDAGPHASSSGPATPGWR